MSRRYLIVDDNVAFAENLAEILRDLGAEVEVAPGAAEALLHIRQTTFDAMITDMRMPVVNGAQLVHQLRRFDPGLPVIVATAYSDDEDLRVARSEGLLAILPKPLPLDRVADLLAHARRDGMVALIEDDVALSDNLSEALRARGFTAVTASSVVETERLGGVQPFVGVVDLRVPGGPDGAALERLRSRFPKLPVLVITAHDDPGHPVAAEKVFHKPFRPDELFGDVERLYARGGAEA